MNAAQAAYRSVLHAEAIAAITSPAERESAAEAKREHAVSIEFRKSARKFALGSHPWASMVRLAIHHEQLYVAALVRSEELRIGAQS